MYAFNCIHRYIHADIPYIHVRYHHLSNDVYPGEIGENSGAQQDSSVPKADLWVPKTLSPFPNFHLTDTSQNPS